MKAEEGIALLGAGVAAYALWRAYGAREGKEAPVIGGGISGARVSSAVTRLTEPLSVSLPSISVSLPSISLPSISFLPSISLPGAEDAKAIVDEVKDVVKDVVDTAKNAAAEMGKTIKGLVNGVKTAAIVGTAAAAAIPTAYVSGKAALAIGQAVTKAPLLSAEALPTITPMLGATAAVGTAAQVTKRVIETGVRATESIKSQLESQPITVTARVYRTRLEALESAAREGKTIDELRRMFKAEEIQEWLRRGGVPRYA